MNFFIRVFYIACLISAAIGVIPSAYGLIIYSLALVLKPLGVTPAKWSLYTYSTDIAYLLIFFGITALLVSTIMYSILKLRDADSKCAVCAAKK